MSKDFLSREANAIFPTLSSRQKQFHRKWFKQTKKHSSFGKGTAWWMFCIHLCRRNHLLWVFAAGILWKTQPCDIFARYFILTICDHGGSLKDDYCSIFPDEILHSTLCQMFCLPWPSNIYGESDFVSSVLQNRSERYSFFLQF